MENNMKITTKFKNLGFMNILLEEAGISKKELARRMGRAQQTIIGSFLKDDSDISRLQEWADAIGYELTFKFKTTDPKMDRTLYNLRITDPEGNPIKKSRLYYIAKLLQLCDISYVDIAEITGLTPGAISYSFKRDDIRISHLYKIADTLGWELLIDAKKK